MTTAVLACLLIGCSGGSTQPQPSPSSSRSLPGRSFSQPLPLLTPSESQGLLTLPWKLWRISHDGRRIFITYAAGGGCVAPVGVEVIEQDDQVTIAPKSRSTASPRTVCTTELLVGKGYLALRTALGDRHLIHARPSAGWRGVL
jgi:hypothetical protein